MKVSVRKLVISAVIGAVYAVLTMVLAPVSYGPVQFRISEAMCILPFFYPFTSWGLFIGCILANVISEYGIIDIVFGSLATLLAAATTAAIGKAGRDRIWMKVLACLPPVIFNGVIVGAVLAYSATPDAFMQGMLVMGGQVALGEAVVMYVVGLPLMIYLPKKVFGRIKSLSDL